MKRLIIVGSPRTNGRSAHLAEMLFEANIDEHPEDELFLVPLSEVEVGPCIGCNACREKMPVILKGGDGEEVTVERNRCVFDDDMQSLYDLIDDADEVTVVSPVYFSGAPAQMKCLLDRLQPYFWAHGGKYPEAKRPAILHVIGEGGDPHGYQALVSEVKSALAVAGFNLERVLDWVGKITEDGDIVADATEKKLGKPRLDLSSDSIGLAADEKRQERLPEAAPAKGSGAKGSGAKARPAKARPANGAGAKARLANGSGAKARPAKGSGAKARPADGSGAKARPANKQSKSAAGGQGRRKPQKGRRRG